MLETSGLNRTKNASCLLVQYIRDSWTGHSLIRITKQNPSLIALG